MNLLVQEHRVSGKERLVEKVRREEEEGEEEDEEGRLVLVFRRSGECIGGDKSAIVCLVCWRSEYENRGCECENWCSKK